MREMIAGQIERGGYDLNEMIGTINYYHVAGELSTEDREWLINYAREKAIAAMELDPKEEILALWAAVRELQAAVQGGGQGGQTGGGEDEYPAWVQPTGAHNAYNTGDKMTYTDGHKYHCLADGIVWGPDTYPAGWERDD